ncbi:MAG: 50S ribosomal protein L22 [Dehalococcoidia bacterium]|nr:50S ribosomal protein L22 [Dehalococcoidia bacterium]
MQVRAVSKDVGLSPRKVALVMDAVRGKHVHEALAVLRFIPTPGARALAKTIKSAAANAENNFQMLPSDLKIVGLFAEKGHFAKRFRPQARGRVAPLLRRACHIHVVVAGEEA